jgi:hypothetical protein
MAVRVSIAQTMSGVAPWTLRAGMSDGPKDSWWKFTGVE